MSVYQGRAGMSNFFSNAISLRIAWALQMYQGPCRIQSVSAENWLGVTISPGAGVGDGVGVGLAVGVAFGEDCGDGEAGGMGDGICVGAAAGPPTSACGVT